MVTERTCSDSLGDESRPPEVRGPCFITSTEVKNGFRVRCETGEQNQECEVPTIMEQKGPPGVSPVLLTFPST